MPFEPEFYKMWDMPQANNKVCNLFLYLEQHKDADEGTWDYIITPEISAHLNLFSVSEYNTLVDKMCDLDEDLLFRLADVFLFEIDNEHFHEYFLYCKIFMMIHNLEHKEYLIENIHNANCIVKGSQPLSFYLDLRKEVVSVGEKVQRDYTYILGKIDEKIIDERG